MNFRFCLKNLERYLDRYFRKLVIPVPTVYLFENEKKKLTGQLLLLVVYYLRLKE